jgi:hypothetical protein
MDRAFGHIRPVVVCVIVLAGMTAFCGCANTQPMALSSKSKTLDLTTESIGIFTLETLNGYKPGFEPAVSSVAVTPPAAEKAMFFQVGKPYRKGEDRSLAYLVSMRLPPGPCTVGNVSGTSNKLLVIGSFSFPLAAKFTLPPNTVTYLGHISMVNRKRKEGEPRSGSIIPLIDQAVCGYSDGTFDITVSDRSESDIPAFKKTYPVLQECTIDKVIMTR